MSNVVLAARVWATKAAAETVKASRRNAIFLRMRALRGVLPGISEWTFCFTHRTLLLPSTQHMYQQSEPQRDQGRTARSTRLTGPISRAKSGEARLSQCGFSPKTGLWPHSDNAGGLNGSLQHLRKIFLYASRRLNSLTGTNSNKTKALFRVRLSNADQIDARWAARSEQRQ